MTEWFSEHTWQEFKELLQSDDLDSEFMPSEPLGLTYFLPAVLLYTLESYETKKESIWEWSEKSGIICAPISRWVEVIVPEANSEGADTLKMAAKSLNGSQIELITQYLIFFHDAAPAEEDVFRDNIKKALTHIWAVR